MYYINWSLSKIAVALAAIAVANNRFAFADDTVSARTFTIDNTIGTDSPTCSGSVTLNIVLPTKGNNPTYKNSELMCAATENDPFTKSLEGQLGSLSDWNTALNAAQLTYIEDCPAPLPTAQTKCTYKDVDHWGAYLGITLGLIVILVTLGVVTGAYLCQKTKKQGSSIIDIQG